MSAFGAEEKAIIDDLIDRGFSSKYIISKYIKAKYPHSFINEYRLTQYFKANKQDIKFKIADQDLPVREPADGEEADMVRELIDSGIKHYKNIANITGVMYGFLVTKKILLDGEFIEKQSPKRSIIKMTEEEYEFVKELYLLGLPILKYISIMASTKFNRKITTNTVKEALEADDSIFFETRRQQREREAAEANGEDDEDDEQVSEQDDEPVADPVD